MHQQTDVERARDFCGWLRQARVALDLTQEALAEAVSCSEQTVRAFESGRRRPSREMAARLAATLRLPQDERDSFVRLARAPLAGVLTGPSATLLDAAPSKHRRVQLPPDALIGRHADLQRVRQALLVDGRRLVTLLGPGGIGKTRLALQAAADLAANFDDGVAVVALAPLTDVADLPTAIAAALDCPLTGTQPPEEALLTFLRERALLLGGAPLGIELAATWVRVMSCAEIVAEMEQSIDFLELDDRDIPARHRSLRAVIDHSWALLTSDEQRLLLRLSVFRGGGLHPSHRTRLNGDFSQLV